MKKAKTVDAPLASVTVRYDLFDLPTAQHKAGLAGLLLQIQSMQVRKFPQSLIPEVLELSATQVTIRFTEQSTQSIFDDVYDAEIVEVASKSKWPGHPPKREEEVEESEPATNKRRHSKRFIYDVVQPCGHFLRAHFQDGDGLWLKLWRNMLWDIPRSKPATRVPFKCRAEKKPCSEGAPAWEDLVNADKARQKNMFRTGDVSSALLLGAQAVNAEAVPFVGRVEHSVLLHFWSLTVLVYVPQQIDHDGESKFVGYVLAVPEVSNLEDFCEDYTRLLEELPTEAQGYRPAGAVIDIPAQSAIEFLDHLFRLTDLTATSTRLKYSVSSVEFLHLVKTGNNVKSMSSGRVATEPLLLEKYRSISPHGKKRYRNSLFRAGLLKSLLNRDKWYASLEDALLERPWPFFVRCEKSPRKMPWFSADAASRFQLSNSEFQGEVKIHAMTDQNSMSAAKPKSPLDLLIYRLITRYVKRKAEQRSNLKWSDFKKTKTEKGKEVIDVPREYRDAREKIASDAFLAMRSRRKEDFIDYFTSNICSVAQFLREDEFHIVAEALLNSPDEVKTISMLALSANSY